MARLSLQIKNVATLVLSLGTSVSAAISVRRYFEHGGLWVPVTCAVVALGCQIALLFIESKEIESKEEEELSLSRRERLDRCRHAIAENEKLSQQIQAGIDAGDHEAVMKWWTTRKKFDE